MGNARTIKVDGVEYDLSKLELVGTKECKEEGRLVAIKRYYSTIGKYICGCDSNGISRNFPEGIKYYEIDRAFVVYNKDKAYEATCKKNKELAEKYYRIESLVTGYYRAISARAGLNLKEIYFDKLLELMEK